MLSEVNLALDPSQGVRLGDALLQMNRGIKELRLLIGLENHHGRLSMNRGVANPIKTSAHTCNGYLGNSPSRPDPHSASCDHFSFSAWGLPDSYPGGPLFIARWLYPTTKEKVAYGAA
jgi:hypothetical protein